jgi:hypothetical protein
MRCWRLLLHAELSEHLWLPGCDRERSRYLDMVHQRRFERKSRISASIPELLLLLKPQTKLAQDRSAFDARRPRSTSFVAGADGHSGTLIMEAAQTANQSVLLTTAHTG